MIYIILLNIYNIFKKLYLFIFNFLIKNTLLLPNPFLSPQPYTIAGLSIV